MLDSFISERWLSSGETVEDQGGSNLVWPMDTPSHYVLTRVQKLLARDGGSAFS